jgi:hypothetical protein
MRTPVIGFLAVTCVAQGVGAYAAEISVREVEQGHYELVLTGTDVLDERVAQAYVAQAATQVCNGLVPTLGKYRFESKEALGIGALAREPATYRFIQELTCSLSSEQSTASQVATRSSPEEARRAEAQVRKMTKEYFRALNMRDFDAAYSQTDPAAIGPDKAAWVRDKQAFQALAGEMTSGSVVKTTVYDNPPDAPEPGLYIAADFQNSYKNVPYECGYLMWFRATRNGPFRVTRSEIGNVTTENLRSIPEGQRPELLRKLRCVAP